MNILKGKIIQTASRIHWMLGVVHSACVKYFGNRWSRTKNIKASIWSMPWGTHKKSGHNSKERHQASIFLSQKTLEVLQNSSENYNMMSKIFWLTQPTETRIVWILVSMLGFKFKLQGTTATSPSSQLLNVYFTQFTNYVD